MPQQQKRVAPPLARSTVRRLEHGIHTHRTNSFRPTQRVVCDCVCPRCGDGVAFPPIICVATTVVIVIIDVVVVVVVGIIVSAASHHRGAEQASCPRVDPLAGAVHSGVQCAYLRRICRRRARSVRI